MAGWGPFCHTWNRQCVPDVSDPHQILRTCLLRATGVGAGAVLGSPGCSEPEVHAAAHHTCPFPPGGGSWDLLSWAHTRHPAGRRGSGLNGHMQMADSKVERSGRAFEEVLAQNDRRAEQNKDRSASLVQYIKYSKLIHKVCDEENIRILNKDRRPV